MDCFHGRAFSSAQTRTPRVAEHQVTLVSNLTRHQSNLAGGACRADISVNVVFPTRTWGSTGSRQDWCSQGPPPICDVFTVFSFCITKTWIWRCCTCWWLNQGGHHWADSEPRLLVPWRAGLSTGVSECPCMCNLALSFASQWWQLLFDTIWPHPAELQKTSAPWGLGFVGCWVGFFFWSKWLWLSSSCCSKKSYYSFFLTSLCLSLTDLNNSKAPI